MSSHLKNKAGFALVTVLGLVSFIILLVFGVQSLIMIKGDVTKNLKAVEIAQQNARVGMQVALGELQESLGKGKRAVSKAGVLGYRHEVGPEKTEWIGVWDTETKEFVRWLVSADKAHEEKSCAECEETANVAVPVGNGSFRYEIAVNEEGKGVRLDLVNGGLQKNLMSILDGSDSGKSEEFMFDDDVNGSNKRSAGAPKWKVLRFPQFGLDGNGKLIKPTPIDIQPVDKSKGLTYPDKLPYGPIVEACELKFDIKAGKKGISRVYYKLSVTLRNPYEQDLSEETYKLGFLYIPKKDSGKFSAYSLSLEDVSEGDYRAFVKGVLKTSFKGNEVKTFTFKANQDQETLNLIDGNQLVENYLGHDNTSVYHDYKKGGPSRNIPVLYVRLSNNVASSSEQVYQQINVKEKANKIVYNIQIDSGMNLRAPIVYRITDSVDGIFSMYSNLKPSPESIADLANLNLTVFNHNADRVIGNSWMPKKYQKDNEPCVPESIQGDYSLLMNKAIWDHYYLSEDGVEIPEPFNVNEHSADKWEVLLLKSKKLQRYSRTMIRQIAEEMPRQVMRRGPFLSISEFINRKLDSSDLAQKGALQAAIDKTGINDNSSELDQAKVLEDLGNNLCAHLDSFKIKGYGESLNKKGEVQARAVCEAVVQRDTKDLKFKIASFRWLDLDDEG